MAAWRAPASLVALAIALAATGAPAVAQEASPVATPASQARLIELPGDRVFPEGIAYQASTGDFFVGSYLDGTLYRGNVQSGQVQVLVPGVPGSAAMGMKLDDQGRLYVASGQTGLLTVHDAATGDLLAVFDNGLAPNTFLNDVAIAPNGDVYVTDSFNPFIYRLPAGSLQTGRATPVAGTPVPAQTGTLEVGIDLNGTAFAFGQGYNANGIVVTPDGSALLVDQTNTGTLYRIGVADGAVTPIDLGDASLVGSDGMLLDGQTLYVVHDGQIAVVQLSADYGSGQVVTNISDPSFPSASTIAGYDGCLLVVNSQIDQIQGQPVLPFTISAIPIPPATGGTPTAGAARC